MWRIISLRMVERTPSVNFVRLISHSSAHFKSHYDVLGLTPKATQSDIKAAYYKLSMVYHPDKNKDLGASSTFRDITAAYEVLGNYKLRKLYDRGLLQTAGAGQAASVHDHAEEKFYQSRASRYSTPSHSGKNPIYDFDEWARQHYGSSFAKRVEAKARWKTMVNNNKTKKGEMQSDVTMAFVLSTMAIFIYTSYLLSESYDVDRTKKEKANDDSLGS